VPLSYEQQPNESAPAFRAYALYRDLGADRSLDRAYAAYRGAVPHGIAPGQWNLWSVKYSWVARALAYDAHLDAEKRKLRERKTLELETRRWEWELRNQDRLERLVEAAQLILDKAGQTPVADVVVVKDETEESIQFLTKKKTRTKTSVKALKMAGYARLMQEVNESARQAVVGVRLETRKAIEAAPAQRVSRIVYRAPESDRITTVS
jgi:hypothetical protein